LFHDQMPARDAGAASRTSLSELNAPVEGIPKLVTQGNSIPTQITPVSNNVSPIIPQ